MERIITQKWIAIYPDGPEGWSEYRRTGYPEVIPVVRNSSNGTIDTELQVRRLPYTRDEKINNASGVASGISALGGQDTGCLLYTSRQDTGCVGTVLSPPIYPNG